MVLFHAATHTNTYPPVKKIGTLYALLSVEQPKYVPILSDTVRLRRTFDVLSTYSLQPLYPGTSIPNLPLTYYPLHLLAAEAVLQPPRPFKEKTGYGTGEAEWTVRTNFFPCVLLHTIYIDGASLCRQWVPTKLSSVVFDLTSLRPIMISQQVLQW